MIKGMFESDFELEKTGLNHFKITSKYVVVWSSTHESSTHKLSRFLLFVFAYVPHQM